MQTLRIILLGTLLGTWAAVPAQVYKSTDSEGNVTFSDQPTPDSKTVDVPEPNVGDSVEVPPPAPEPAIENPPKASVESPPVEPQGELVDEKEEDDDDHYHRRDRPRVQHHRRR